MQAKKSKMFVYVKQFKRTHHLDNMQLAIILGFLLISTLASLWLPVYFASQALNGLWITKGSTSNKVKLTFDRCPDNMLAEGLEVVCNFLRFYLLYISQLPVTRLARGVCFFMALRFDGLFFYPAINSGDTLQTAAFARFETKMSCSATRCFGFATLLRPPICNPYFCKASWHQLA